MVRNERFKYRGCKNGFYFSGVMNLFAKRPPLSFTNSQYSLLTSVGSAMMFVPALSTWLFKTSDMFLIVTGLVFEVFKMVLTAYSTQQWMLFLGIEFCTGSKKKLIFRFLRSSGPWRTVGITIYWIPVVHDENCGIG